MILPRSALYQNLPILIFIIFISIFNVAVSCKITNTTTNNLFNSTRNTRYRKVIHFNHTENYITYIKIACNSATYPSICYKSLRPYALKIKSDPLKLCNVSLSLALKAAHRASSTISKLLRNNDRLADIEEHVVKDCLENLKESIGELRDSVNAMERLDDIIMDKDFQKSNIKTWVSAAITEDQTCSDGLFDGENMVDGNVREKIKNNVLKVARISSNALYFINNLSY